MSIDKKKKKTFFKDRVVCNSLLVAKPALGDNDAVHLKVLFRRLVPSVRLLDTLLMFGRFAPNIPEAMYHSLSSKIPSKIPSRPFRTVHDILTIQS